MLTTLDRGADSSRPPRRVAPVVGHRPVRAVCVGSVSAVRHAVLIGGSGMIGRAIARRLLSADWIVQIVGRDAANVPADLRATTTFLAADRSDDDALHAVIPSGADLLVDCVCFTAAHARTLLPLLGDVGSAVLLSSKAVYVDDAGHHSNSPRPPRFDGPVAETQPTLPPDWSDDYDGPGYGACKVAAELTLLDTGAPVTVLRPSSVHGEGATKPNEWTFVKRVLDGRRRLPLAHRGRSGAHPSAAVNIAELVSVVADQPAPRVLNAADPDAPTGRQIAHLVADELGHSWDEVLLDDDADPSLGAHPWNRWPRVELDMSAAIGLGYRPVGNYASTVAPTLHWLVNIARPGPSGARLPDEFDNAYFARFVDYAAEDAALG